MKYAIKITKITTILFLIPLFFSQTSLALTNAYQKIHLILNTGFSKPYLIPSIKIQINNVSFPIEVDTGASNPVDIILSSKIAKKLHLIYTNKKQCSLSQSGKNCFRLVKIQKIKIGDRVFHHLTGLVATHQWGGAQFYKKFHHSAGYQNGVLTLHFLKKFNWLFDYQKHTAEIFLRHEDLQGKIKNWQGIHFSTTSGNIITKNFINGHYFNLVWDTGFLPSQISPTVVSKNLLTSCDDRIYYYFEFNQKIKCTKIKKLDAAFVVKDLGLPPEVPFKGVVASDFFNKNRVLIDFDKKILYFSRLTRPITTKKKPHLSIKISKI